MSKSQRTVSSETRDKVLRSALSSSKVVRVTPMTGTQRRAASATKTK